jgi:hypothetical protein
MRTIRTEIDKHTTRTTQICSCCHYIFEVETDLTPGAYQEHIILGPSDNGNRPFIQLLNKQFFTDEYNDTQTINLYACPRCLTVQLSDEKIKENNYE